MNTDADDFQHGDSLSGSELGARAQSLLPSLRPVPPPPRRWRGFFAWVGASGALLGSVVAAQHARTPDVPVPDVDRLQVEGQTLKYSEKFAARAGIRTVPVAATPFAPLLSLHGKTTFDPQHVVFIGANRLGTVRRVLKYEGEVVAPGDTLAELASPNLARLEAAAFLAARAAPRGTLGVSKLRSPLSGTVVERRIGTGQSVRGESVAFVVANLDHLWLEVPVDEVQRRALHVGDRVELARESEAAAPVEGRVAGIDAQPPQENQPAFVRIEVDNHAGRLRLGQAVTACVHARRTRTRVLLIPNRALALIGGQPSVFVSAGHNSVNAKAVVLGGRNAEDSEVVAGLISGDQVVSEGVGVLKDESFL